MKGVRMNGITLVAGLAVASLLMTLFAADVQGQRAGGNGFNGLHMSMGNLSRLSDAKTRSISAENFTGEKGKGGMSTTGHAAKGAARDLGRGWKVSPYIRVKPGETFTL